MAIEKGLVTEIRDGLMEVRVPRAEGCSACAARNACTFVGPDSAYRRVRLAHRTGIAVGDLLSLEFSDAARNLSALILFGSPILFVAGGVLVAQYVQFAYAEVVAVLAGVVLYGLTLILANRWVSRVRAFQPRVRAGPSRTERADPARH